ncbi:MAG: hypothetical protein SFW66_06700 [Gammaproteobacteria bacterium]|nr:hypothetical protein [Gammaproteobacteria bacterium]
MGLFLSRLVAPAETDLPEEKQPLLAAESELPIETDDFHAVEGIANLFIDEEEKKEEVDDEEEIEGDLQIEGNALLEQKGEIDENSSERIVVIEHERIIILVYSPMLSPRSEYLALLEDEKNELEQKPEPSFYDSWLALNLFSRSVFVYLISTSAFNAGFNPASAPIGDLAEIITVFTGIVIAEIVLTSPELANRLNQLGEHASALIAQLTEWIREPYLPRLNEPRDLLYIVPLYALGNAALFEFMVSHYSVESFGRYRGLSSFSSNRLATFIATGAAVFDLIMNIEFLEVFKRLMRDQPIFTHGLPWESISNGLMFFLLMNGSLNNSLNDWASGENLKFSGTYSIIGAVINFFPDLILRYKLYGFLSEENARIRANYVVLSLCAIFAAEVTRLVYTASIVEVSDSQLYQFVIRMNDGLAMIGDGVLYMQAFNLFVDTIRNLFSQNEQPPQYAESIAPLLDHSDAASSPRNYGAIPNENVFFQPSPVIQHNEEKQEPELQPAVQPQPRLNGWCQIL